MSTEEIRELLEELLDIADAYHEETRCTPDDEARQEDLRGRVRRALGSLGGNS